MFQLGVDVFDGEGRETFDPADPRTKKTSTDPNRQPNSPSTLPSIATRITDHRYLT